MYLVSCYHNRTHEATLAFHKTVHILRVLRNTRITLNKLLELNINQLLGGLAAMIIQPGALRVFVVPAMEHPF